MSDQRSFDVGVSYASEDLALTTRIVGTLRDAKIRVFHDEATRLAMWGSDLRNELRETYAQRCELVLLVFSEAYFTKRWTLYEFETICARLETDGPDFLLPLRIGTAAIPSVIEWMSCLQYRDGVERELASTIGARLRRYPTRDRVLALLTSERLDHRLDGAEAAIGMANSADASALLTHALSGERDSSAKAAICWALKWHPSVDAIPALTATLFDPNWSVRSAAGWALVAIGAPCREQVIAATQSPDADDGVREMARLVLERL